MKVIIAVFILCLSAFTAHAALYSNDTDSVDIDYTGPAPIGAPDSNLPQGGGGGTQGGGGDSSGGDSGGGTNNSGNLWDASGVTVTTTTGGTGTSNNGTGTQNSTQSSGDENGTAGVPVSGDDILNTLLGSQAISISGSASDGSDSEVRINGAKAREALKARGITALSIVNRFTSKFLSKKDFALGAVSDILANENIEEVIMSLNAVQLTYRAQGRLFAVFPFTYPITVSVNPYAETSDSRVGIKFPWYSFFIQKYVSKALLIRDINAAIDRFELTEVNSVDARSKFLSAVTQVILLRADTVEGSLR